MGRAVEIPIGLVTLEAAEMMVCLSDVVEAVERFTGRLERTARGRFRQSLRVQPTSWQGSTCLPIRPLDLEGAVDNPAALPHLVDLLLAVVLGASLEGRAVRILREHLRPGSKSRTVSLARLARSVWIRLEPCGPTGHPT
jgi:hypothetical protein